MENRMPEGNGKTQRGPWQSPVHMCWELHGTRNNQPNTRDVRRVRQRFGDMVQKALQGARDQGWGGCSTH